MNRNLMIATHTIAVATFVLVLVVIAPRRGLHLAGDEGFFLVSALAAVQGQGAEIIIPQSAHYLLNTILIGAGITEVITLKQIYLVACTLGALVLVSGLVDHRGNSAFVPLAAVLPALFNLNQVFNHYTASIFLLSIGFGLFAWSGRLDATPRAVMLLLAGSVLGLTTIFNPGVAVALLVGVVCLFFSLRADSRFLLIYSFCATAVVSWLAFTTWVGAENLLHRPAHSSVALLDNALKVAWFSLQSVVAVLAVMLVIVCLRRKHCAGEAMFIAVAGISTFWLGFFILRLINNDAACFPYSPFPLHLSGSEFCHPSRIGVLGHAILLTSLVGLFFHTKLRLISCLASAGPKKLGSRTLWWSIWTALFRIDMTTPSGATLLVGAIVSLAAAVSAFGSNSHYGVAMSFSAGLAIGISLVAVGHIATESWQKQWVACNAILAVICGLVFTLSYNHSSGRPVFANSDIMVDKPALRGNYFTPAEVQFLTALEKAFEAHDCRSSEFIVLDYMPLIYYVTGQIPRDRLLRAIRPAFYYPAHAIMLNLKLAKSWCVLDFSTSESENSQRRGQQVPSELIRSYVSTNSEKSILLPSPEADIIGQPKLWVNNRHSSAGPIGKP